MPYHIYVIELDRKVYSESRKFREANPQFNPMLDCLYVGMTSKSPKVRFEQHKSGYTSKRGHNLSSRIVFEYGKMLRPSLYRQIPVLKTRTEALDMEKKLALELRRQRYAVWFN
jgi:predicted GIY-YIG superfamily endonuclease